MIFFLLALAGCCCCLPIGPSEDRSAERARQGEQDVADIRGLPFRSRVAVQRMSPEDSSAFFADEFSRELPEQKLRAMETAWRSLGLLPKTSDLRREYLAIHDDQVAGFYDPRAKRLTMVDGMLANGETGIVIHELAHALTDQHFGMEAMMRAAESNDDAAAALGSLIEGDATYVMVSFSLGGINLSRVPRLAKLFQEAIRDGVRSETSARVPPVLREGLASPYADGLAFVVAGMARGGWDEINAAWTDPPASTEQILHPETYFGRRDPPVRVILPDLARELGPEWTRGYENTLGEQGVRSLFSTLLPDDARINAYADGWGGDTYGSYVRGNEACLVWASAWDDAREAGTFARALSRAYAGQDAQVLTSGTTVVLLKDIPRQRHDAVQKRLNAIATN